MIADIGMAADINTQMQQLLLPTEETFFEQLLRFGLYVGAVFQIACLLAIVVYQSGPPDGESMFKVYNKHCFTCAFVCCIGIDNTILCETYYIDRFRMTEVTWNAQSTAPRLLPVDDIDLVG